MDIQYLLLLQALREATGNLLNGFFLYVTQFGESIFPYLLVMGFYWCVDKRLGNRMLFGISGSAMLNGVIKLTACVYRPWVRDAAIMPPDGAKAASTGYSFPSGHTANATASYGVLAYHYRRNRALAGCLVALVLLIMFSRNFLGVHTPQDVLVSLACTTVLLVLVHRMLDWVEAGHNRDLIVAGGAVAVVVLCLVYFLTKSYPVDLIEGVPIVDPKAMMPDSFLSAGTIFGLVLGWLIERRWIRFSTEVPVSTRVVRFMTGAAMYLFLLYTAMPILRMGMGKLWGSMAAGFVAFFYCVALHPMLFTLLERRAKAPAAR